MMARFWIYLPTVLLTYNLALILTDLFLNEPWIAFIAGAIVTALNVTIILATRASDRSRLQQYTREAL